MLNYERHTDCLRFKSISQREIWLPATRTNDNRKRKKTEPDKKEDEWGVIEKWLVCLNIAPCWCSSQVRVLLWPHDVTLCKHVHIKFHDFWVFRNSVDFERLYQVKIWYYIIQIKLFFMLWYQISTFSSLFPFIKQLLEIAPPFFIIYLFNWFFMSTFPRLCPFMASLMIVPVWPHCLLNYEINVKT